jgi:hypothetical protein
VEREEAESTSNVGRDTGAVVLVNRRNVSGPITSFHARSGRRDDSLGERR